MEYRRCCRAGPRRTGTARQTPARTPGRSRRRGPQSSAGRQTAPAIAGRAPHRTAGKTTPARPRPSRPCRGQSASSARQSQGARPRCNSGSTARAAARPAVPHPARDDNFGASCRDSAEGGDAQHTQRAHDAACQQHAAHAGADAGLKVHVQKAGGQRAGPRTRAGQRNADEQQQRPRQAAARRGLQLRAALVAFFEAEGEELADDRLIRTPLQHLAGKEEDERHGEHIADDGDDVHLPQRQAHGHAHGDRAAQLDQRDHRN